MHGKCIRQLLVHTLTKVRAVIEPDSTPLTVIIYD